jgi:hypothetical protein
LLLSLSLFWLVPGILSAFTTTTTPPARTTTTTTSPLLLLSSIITTTTRTPTSLHAATSAAVTIPNPFKRLPWNARKEREREARRFAQERAKLHRELGITEDATYEEIVAATDALIAKANDANNLKQKVKIEVAKDKILQIRLNERLAGLTQTTKEARAQSSYEVEGVDDDEDDKPKAAKEWNAPAWTQGLVVKPNETHLKSQIRLWGIITAIGAALPPAQDYLGRFTWLICVAQLTFRGMPQQDRDAGGMGVNFGAARGGGHRKVAFALGLTTWIVGAILAYGCMPAWARGQRWTSTVAFALQNLIFGIVSCYLQPYKG